MSVIWLTAEPQKRADWTLALAGNFAVRVIASLESLAFLARASAEAKQPQAVIVPFAEETEPFVRDQLIRTLAKSHFFLVCTHAKETQKTQPDRLSRLTYITENKLSELACYLRPPAEAKTSEQSSSEGPFCLSFSELSLQIDRHELMHRDEAFPPVTLSAKETAILQTLFEQGKLYTSRRLLLERAWKGVKVGSRTIDSHICRLRKKLKPMGVGIEGAYSQGYRMIDSAEF